MGACKRRSGNTPAAKRAVAPPAYLPPIDNVKKAWLRAIQEEDPAAAGECGRLCETLRGAELFADSDGLDAFVAIAMGQSTTGGQGGLMVALAQALMTDMSEFKVAIFETLMVAARWPSLRGRIAGSGVLGVVSATLLAPRHPPQVKALMIRLCSILGVDAADTIKLGDPRRAEEFVKIRAQLISSGVVKTMVELTKRGASDVILTSAAASAVASLAGFASDADTINALSDAGAVPALLTHLPGDAEGPVKETTADQVATDAPLDASATASASTPVATDAPLDASATASASTPLLTEVEDKPVVSAAVLSDRLDEEGSDDEGLALSALPAITSALAAIAATEGTLTDTLRAPLYEETTLTRLRSLLGGTQGDCQRGVQEGVLRCLAAIGRETSKLPVLDASLVEDLVRILTLGGEAGLAIAVGELLEVLLADKKNTSSLGDLRRLRRVASTLPQGQMTGALRALQATPSCCHCGCAPGTALLLCSRCKQVEYCSRDCQKAAWADHKTICGQEPKSRKSVR